jgi:HAMP domain-containing protein
MAPARHTGRPRGVGRTLAWVVGLPTTATLVAFVALFAASYRAESMLHQALLWSRHLVALHELGEAAHDYVDDVEARLGRRDGTPLLRGASPGDPASRVVDAFLRSRSLAEGFEGRERDEEYELEQAVGRLVELGAAALRGGTLEGVGELGRWYRDQVAARIGDRLREEERGARAALQDAQAGSAALLGAAALLAVALVAAATWRSWRLARHLGDTLALLGAGAKRISEGDLEHRLAVASQDEIGAVAGAFDRMAQALRDNTVTRHELAREVADRTAELESSHAELELSHAELEGNLEKLRAAQEQLVASERMAAIGVLAAGVAHDVNSPLAFILSNLTFAAGVIGDRERTPEDEAEALAALREAREGAERVRDIVRALGGLSLTDPPCGATAAPRKPDVTRT